MIPILVTGDTGYIGSHTTLALLKAGFDEVVLDNLFNGSAVSLKRVAQVAGREPAFVEGGIFECAVLDRLFAECWVVAVLYFAGCSKDSIIRIPLRFEDLKRMLAPHFGDNRAGKRDVQVLQREVTV